ncbi:uncharacterized protein LOC130956088 isoform X1 [Arachis stenosperma]|uniref:uncharacterized protein LOC130956088 isoform X1 n=1 Tax=Arachis stenosperma TaxID=217475 RepID=UPI0025AB9BBB|nr:uncharacterized protein LOC130956088 isoform X1 [Arachis stenosperma]
MDNPCFVVPYHDPYDTPPLSPSFFNISNPTLLDLTNVSSGTKPSHSQQKSNGIQEANLQPTFDPMIQDNNSVGGTGGNNFESIPLLQVHSEEGLSHDFNNDVNTITLSHWPLPPVPFSCSCCSILREIVHTNGFNFTKVEIHGRPGLISHAIQHPTVNGDFVSTSNLQYQMIDFCRRSIDDVKNFLVEYCRVQSAAGYFMLQDPLSAYYEALCTGLEWVEEFSDDTDDLNASNSDDENEQVADNGVGASGKAPRRLSLSEQRDRAGKMKLDDFAPYFHFPIEEASRQMNICPTVVKKICRKEGLSRWPYRKIKSTVRQISQLKRTMESKDERSKARIQAEIYRLHLKLREICAGRYPSGIVIP